jgi:DNA-binding response OmpR family regulator
VNPARAVLVVEDEYILAMDIARFLQERGYGVLGPVPSVHGALALIDRERPAAAVLDIQLEAELSYPVADRLAELGIPFVFRTGHAPDKLPDRLRGRPLHSKLEDLAVLGRELDALLRH